MRTTELRCAQHIGRQFKFRWLLQGRRKVPDTGAEAILAAKGIEVFDPKEILSPPFQRNHLELPPVVTDDEEIKQEKSTPCYVFHNRYSPPAGVAQAQHLSNCIVRSTLPESMLSHVTDNSVEEDDKVKEAILHAHLLDSHQEKLPRILDVINKPGWSDPLQYAMPVRRRNKNLTYQLILLLDQLFPEAASRHMVENTKLQVMLQHSGKLMQMQHEAACILSSSVPLSPPMGKAEVSTIDGEPLPDIYPFSPFLYCKKHYDYSEEDYFSVVRNDLYPHTIFIHLNMPLMRHTEDNFCGITILKAFSHAAAYAKQWCKIEDGNLEKPLALQIVHTNGVKYHIGVFQLNTLNLNGITKNIFWSHPWEILYESCNFKGAKPNLEGYNPKVFSLLKALHLQ